MHHRQSKNYENIFLNRIEICNTEIPQIEIVLYDRGEGIYFLYLCSKITSMTFEEAVSLVDRIKEQVIGVPVKGRLIESLFIGPTNWNEMHVFMNICLQKGEDEAIDEFIGKSFSVYGRSVTYINPDLPRWDVTVLDDWEKTIYN